MCFALVGLAFGENHKRGLLFANAPAAFSVVEQSGSSNPSFQITYLDTGRSTRPGARNRRFPSGVVNNRQNARARNIAPPVRSRTIDATNPAPDGTAVPSVPAAPTAISGPSQENAAPPVGFSSVPPTSFGSAPTGAIALDDGLSEEPVTEVDPVDTDPVPAVPEPEHWLLMIIGVFALGQLLRRRAQSGDQTELQAKLS